MKTALIIIGIITAIIAISFSSSPPKAGVCDTAPALLDIPLPTPEEIQEHINAVLQAHGEQRIEIDGAIGPATKEAWRRAVALQGGYFITRDEIERTEK